MNEDNLQGLDTVFQQQREAFRRQPMPSRETRLQWLTALAELLRKEQNALTEAVDRDFGNRSPYETRTAELLPSLQGIHYTCKQLKKWMKPSRRRVGLLFQPASARVVYQPLGVVGIIVPWNYPLYLSIGPLISALAAGNRVMIKMSEYSPVTAETLKTLLQTIFSEDLVAVVLGDVDVGIAFAKLPFDHLLFTGSTAVGRQIMRAASDNLTPVTLELGGKSPAIVSETASLREAARRIAFGKCLNAGQTCVAPDYVLVHETHLEHFVELYQKSVRAFYRKMAGNPDYTAIINERQWIRLHDCLNDAEAKGARRISIFTGGDEHDRRLSQTLLLDVRDDMKVMQEEIFGPLLPVIGYQTFDGALQYVNQRPRPLALYYFGYDKAQQQRLLNETHSGGVCLNDSLLHVAQEALPFGGVGSSGMGHYHAHEGFLTFSQAKSVFQKSHINTTRFIYPPYGGAVQKMIYRLFMR